MDEQQRELLKEAYTHAVERFALERPTLYTDADGQRWFLPIELISELRVVDRAIAEAEKCGMLAGRFWGATQAPLEQLERLNVGSLDMWCNESNPADMLPYMEQTGVPLEFASTFQRGFFVGAYGAWCEIRPRLLAAIES